MTTIQYTKQWVRIAGALRPVNYLLAIATAALLLGAAVALVAGSPLLALEVFLGTVVVASFLTALIWRNSKHTEINLGAGLIRCGKQTVPFGAVTDIEFHANNLLLIANETKVLLPVIWLTRDQLIVIERMLSLLSPTIPESSLSTARAQLSELLAA